MGQGMLAPEFCVNCFITGVRGTPGYLVPGVELNAKARRDGRAFVDVSTSIVASAAKLLCQLSRRIIASAVKQLGGIGRVEGVDRSFCVFPVISVRSDQPDGHWFYLFSDSYRCSLCCFSLRCANHTTLSHAINHQIAPNQRAIRVCFGGIVGWARN